LPLLEGIIGKTFWSEQLPWFYYIGRGIARVLFALLTRLEVKGRENIPADGAVLVVANHLNLTDPPLLGISLDRKMMFMAKEELFRSPLTACFVGGFGAFPVHRGKMDRKALRQSQQVLTDGMALIMFPEATRSKTARLQRAYPGSALLAMRAGVPVLPVGISGTERVRGIGWIFRRPRITINIGRPFNLPSAKKLTREGLSRNTDLIMERIAELLPPKYRGVYGKR
jgi:1-acyl-sn-glycerol-3-phosphate acyltransferase